VSEMRVRITAAKAPDGLLDAKLGPGRFQDVQLIAQAATLVAGRGAQGTRAGLTAGVSLGWWSAEDARVLSQAISLFREVQMAARLLGDGALDADNLGAGARAFVLRETGWPDIPALVAAIATALAKALTDGLTVARPGSGETQGAVP
jgi:glutamate-ammonia-ligase adenylyltransferase